MPPITPATFAAVEVVQRNASVVMMTSMEFAFRAMGMQMGDAMRQVAESIGEAVAGALSGDEAKGRSEPAAPAPTPGFPSRAEILEAVKKTLAQMRENEDEKAAFRAVMTEADGQELLAMPGKHLTGLPSLNTPRSDEDLAMYVELHMREDPRWQGFVGDFMDLGKRIAGRFRPAE